MVDVAAFGERLAKQRFKLDGEPRTVERFGLLRRHAACGFFEHESALHREQRSQSEVPLLQRPEFGGDAETIRRRNLRDRGDTSRIKLGMLLLFKSFRILPRR